MTINAYPLAWPQGWPRVAARYRKRARFTKGQRQYADTGDSSWMRHREVTISEGVQRVLKELRTFGVLEGDAIISTNIPVRLDGLPRSDAKTPNDPGVAVYWTRPGEKGGTKVMAIDLYDRLADNLAAIAATLDAMRAIERHGGAQILDRAFTGFAALPSPDASRRTWREVMGFDATELVDRAEVEERYKKLRSERHPDKGGSNEQFTELSIAHDEAQREIS